LSRDIIAVSKLNMQSVSVDILFLTSLHLTPSEVYSLVFHVAKALQRFEKALFRLQPFARLLLLKKDSGQAVSSFFAKCDEPAVVSWHLLSR
jgi:hypothetical protein